MPSLLVIDTATAACSVALFADDAVVATAHRVVGRGHAERLVPMIADLPGGGRADAILVDCGPGSFTGIRVGIAAARGLGFGWQAPVRGYSSTVLIAAAAIARRASPLVVIMEGGHGEVFMQGFDADLAITEPLASRTPAAAIACLRGRRIVGSGGRWLTALDPALTIEDALPDAADALLLPEWLAVLPPSPIYGRAPDAKVSATEMARGPQ